MITSKQSMKYFILRIRFMIVIWFKLYDHNFEKRFRSSRYK